MALYIDDVKMSKKEALGFLGLSSTDIPNNPKRWVFEFLKKTKDTRNGGYRMMRRLGGKPEYSVYVPHTGKEAKIRFARTQTAERGLSAAQSYKYSPKSRFLEVDEEGMVRILDEMEFIFWFLHPLHELSPFKREGTDTDFCYHDSDNIAKKSLDADEYYISAMAIILGDNAWDILRLRRLAKGMRVAGVDDLSDAQVKAKLRDMAKARPVEFYNLAQARDVKFNGVVQDAIDKQILRLETKNGLKRWYLGKDEILPISYGVNEQEALFGHLAENALQYYEKLKAALAGVTQASLLNRPDLDALFEEDEKQEKVAANTAEQIEQANDLLNIVDAIERLKTNEKFRDMIADLAKEDLSNPKLNYRRKDKIERYQEVILEWRSLYGSLEPAEEEEPAQ